MISLLKKIIKKTSLYYPLRNWWAKRKSQKELVDWIKTGKPVPPPHIIKQKALRDYSKMYGLRILVETGTCIGDMVEAMKADFNRIYSIELSTDLYEQAMKRFKGVKNVELLHGARSIVVLSCACLPIMARRKRSKQTINSGKTKPHSNICL